MGPSGSAAPDATAMTAAAQRQQQLQRRSSAGGSTPSASMQLPPPALSFSLPSQLQTPAAPQGRPLSQYGDPVMMMVQPSCACESGSAQGTYWEGVGTGRSPPGSTTGLVVAAGDRSSPSAVLFKGLLRGIVLYEGYRFVRVSFGLPSTISCRGNTVKAFVCRRKGCVCIVVVPAEIICPAWTSAW